MKYPKVRRTSFGLLSILVISIVASFAVQIISPQTARAYSTKDENAYRYLTYFDRCLSKYLDWDGKKNDENNDNLEFSNIDEMFYPGQIVAVGIDLDSKNGVMNCLSVARKGAYYFTGKTGADANLWLQARIWGQILKGKPLKIGTGDGQINPEDVKSNAAKLRKDMASEIKDAGSGRTKKDILDRMEPLFMQCFKNLRASEPKGQAWENGSLVYPSREIYAERKSFDWSDVKHPQINGNSGINTNTGAEVGDIELDFRPGGDGDEFGDRTSHWYPMGEDLANAFGGYRNIRYEGEMMGYCNIFKDHDTYFFGNTRTDKETHWIIRNNKLAFASDANGDGKLDESEISATAPADAGTLENGPDPTATDSSTICKVEGTLGWILTPVCVAAVKATGELSKYISDALEIAPITQDGTAGTVYTAWKSFRDIANAFIVLIFLIAIFYQVLPIEVDAYTVKKVLPRLIVAAIAIQASFFLCQMAIDISNVLGGGIETIFQSINTGSAGGGSAVGVLNTGITLIVAGGILWAFIGPVFFLLISAVLAILTMLISLQAREVIIILLVLLSPVAILASVLPNTEDYFKKWWENFIKLLLMYPMIQVLLSGSVLISEVLNVEGLGQIQQIMVSFIPIIALFMVPAMFKQSGSLMATVGGAINKKGFGYSKAIAGRAKTNAKDINRERGATLLGSDKMRKRALGRALTGNVGFGDRTQRNIRSAMNKNYSEMSESVQDKYQGLGNAARFEKFKELKKSRKAKDQLEAVALGNMIAANGGGPEMGRLFDELEGYEFDKDGKITNADEVRAGTKYTYNKDGSVATATRGKVTRDGKGAVVSVNDRGWNEIAKRNSSFLAGSVPHSVSKPASAAGASQLIAGKGAGFGEEIREQALQMQRDGNSIGLQKLANQFVAAAQREDASDMQGSTIKAFQDLAAAGAFKDANLNFKGDVAGQDLSALAPDQQVKEFIRLTTEGGSLARTVQG